jgi:low affinity Fe/Cu permease
MRWAVGVVHTHRPARGAVPDDGGDVAGEGSGWEGWFNRFAEGVARQVAKPWFFTGCVLTIVVWAPMILVIRNVDTYQLIVNTFTTILTYLLVALLQNTQQRFEDQTVRQNQESLARLDALQSSVAEILARLDAL